MQRIEFQLKWQRGRVQADRLSWLVGPDLKHLSPGPFPDDPGVLQQQVICHVQYLELVRQWPPPALWPFWRSATNVNALQRIPGAGVHALAVAEGQQRKEHRENS